jgi:pimeloyl-ACP methyl ester carboxylesterase
MRVHMGIEHERHGDGQPLLLIHGLGGSRRSWKPVLEELAAEREVVAVDLPGHGETPPLDGENSIATLSDAIVSFLEAENLTGVDVVGNSMGGRIVLELARRGEVGATVALDPGGFWEGWERYFFYGTLAPSIRLVRALQPVMGRITGSAVGRTLLLTQLSARPWSLPGDVANEEMQAFADTPTFDELLRGLAFGSPQEGPAANSNPVVIGWGTKDRITLPRQADRATERFPDATLHWFDGAGHYPHWDTPGEAAELILETTG